MHVRYLLDAEPSPGLLPRVLQPFAKRGLTPDRMWSHRAGDTIHIEVAVEEMTEADAPLVEGNLRQIVGVRSVVLIHADIARKAA